MVGPAASTQAQDVRRAGLHPRPAGGRVVLQGLGRASAAGCRTTWPTATCRRRATPTRRSFKFPRGAILDRNLAEVHAGGRQGPAAGAGVRRPLLVRVRGRRRRGQAPVGGRDEAELHRARSRPTSSSTCEQKYSWLKTPRWKGHAMEVGPLARAARGLRVGQRRSEGGRGRRAEGSSTCRWRRSSRRSAARRRAASRPSWSRAGRRSSTSSSSPTSRTATRARSTRAKWEPDDLAGRGQGRRHDAKRRAARWPTGS